MYMDAIYFVLIAAAAITGFALGIIIEGKLSSREIDSLRERLRVYESLRK